ncbi:VOC family protein [Zooshikella marina]|uniref:VOC family protein n=1 Tax=Zooshikella ganghwensis TaxID=202772 RepID=UPI001BAF4532|nr:VOC family protein [Zooshikella ganghwensis]MBU2706011.1 VOC family protein [Zooshikella ganghwensis]
MIDHITLNVGNLEKSKLFYLSALAPLGLSAVQYLQNWTAIGKDNQPVLWFQQSTTTRPHLSLAFKAESQRQVDEFHTAAISAGGISHGKPENRQQESHSNRLSYSAFVLDPDGHIIEVFKPLE